MTRLRLQDKERLVKLIKGGISINRIVKELQLAKSTVYYYYRKIHGKRFLEPPFNGTLSEEEEIIGVFCGDGSQIFEANGYKYGTQIHFGRQNKEYLYYVKTLYENFFGKNFRIVEEKRSMRIKTLSEKIFQYFRTYLRYDRKSKHSTVHLRNVNLPDEFKIGVLRGLFDTDGSILFKRKENRLRISFCTTSKLLIKQVMDILDEYGFYYSYYIDSRPHKNYKDSYIIQLRTVSVIPFLQLVKPFKAKKLYGPVAQRESTPLA